MTTADYLNQLEQDRQDLVDNLETKGITGLTGDETFTELVPEVLNISGGSTPTLRHIQVGDDLSNKKIYFTIPDNIKDDSFFSQTNMNYFICSNIDMTGHTPVDGGYNSNATIHVRKVSNGNFFVAVGGTNTSRTYVYYYANGSLDYNISVVDLNEYYSVKNACFVNKPIVWVDTTNPLYNYVWVEDEPEPQLRNIQVGDVLYGKHLYYDISSSDLEQLDYVPNIVETQPNPDDYNNTGQLGYSGGEYNFVSISKDNGSIDRLYSNYASYEESPYEVIGTYWQMPVATVMTNDPIFQKIYVDANEMNN